MRRCDFSTTIRSTSSSATALESIRKAAKHGPRKRNIARTDWFISFGCSEIAANSWRFIVLLGGWTALAPAGYSFTAQAVVLELDRMRNAITWVDETDIGPSDRPGRSDVGHDPAHGRVSGAQAWRARHCLARRHRSH